MWLEVLAAILLLICIVLVIRLGRLYAELRRMTRTTAEIRAGNLNLRYRLRLQRKLVMELGGELNRLLDHVQKTFERTRYLEEERKRMIASLSHDLRTPLTSMLGYLEALQQDETLTAAEKSRFIRIAGDKGRSLLERLQEFFELARLEADDAPLQLRRIPLKDVAEEVLLGFYPEFQKAGITPTLQVPEAPLFISGDRAHLRRVLENLISNALRYGRDGGEIGVAVREEADRVRVEVWDRGPGIPERDLPRVFDRFYTGEASRNESLRGTGLGLTIAKALVEKMGGRIEADSKPGEKTVFTCFLNRG